MRPRKKHLRRQAVMRAVETLLRKLRGGVTGRLGWRQVAELPAVRGGACHTGNSRCKGLPWERLLISGSLCLAGPAPLKHSLQARLLPSASSLRFSPGLPGSLIPPGLPPTLPFLSPSGT